MRLCTQLDNHSPSCQTPSLRIMEIGMNITIFEHDSIVFKHIAACISNMFHHVLRGFLGFET